MQGNNAGIIPAAVLSFEVLLTNLLNVFLEVETVKLFVEVFAAALPANGDVALGLQLIIQQLNDLIGFATAYPQGLHDFFCLNVHNVYIFPSSLSRFVLVSILLYYPIMCLSSKILNKY